MSQTRIRGNIKYKSDMQAFVNMHTSFLPLSAGWRPQKKKKMREFYIVNLKRREGDADPKDPLSIRLRIVTIIVTIINYRN